MRFRNLSKTAEHFGVSLSLVSRYVSKGMLRYINIDGHRLIDIDDPQVISVLRAPEGYVTAASMAEAIGLTVKQVQALARTGRIPAVKYMGQWMVDPAATRAELEAMKTEGR